MSSSYKLEENESVLKIILTGKIDESSDYSSIKTEGFKELIVDFNEVSSINSCGIREWINFLLTLKDIPIIYKNCPKIIVDQMSSVNEFLTSKTRVESIYLPYYCEECDREDTSLLKMDDVANDKDISIPPKTCTECQKEMEFDEVPEIYFQFLKSS